MTTERKFVVLMLPFQAYCAVALVGLLMCRAAYGHETQTPLIMFLAWSSIGSSFLWLIGAAVQAHFRLTTQACMNAAFAIATIYAVSYLMPYLART
jgi:hypothetical protein